MLYMPADSHVSKYSPCLVESKLFKGVRKPLKMLVCGFLKTEPTLNFENQKLGFHGSVFKTDPLFFGRFLHFSVSQRFRVSESVKNSKHFYYAKRVRGTQRQMLYVKSEFSLQVYCRVNKVMRKSFEEFGRSTLTD